MSKSQLLTLRNPHAVLAALERRPGDVEELRLPRDPQPAWLQVERLARKNSIKITSAKSGGDQPPSGGHQKGRPHDRDRGRAPGDGRLGGAEALVREKPESSLEDIFPNDSDARGLWLALDCLQDPHNVGAVFRTAAFFGVKGIILTEERSSPLTATTYEIASGGIETVPFVYLTNLKHGLEKAKKAGLWILGSSEHATTDYKTLTADRAWMLVLGNEEKGMRRLTEESCDVVCQIPPQGDVKSLNVSVAAGVLISRLV